MFQNFNVRRIEKEILNFGQDTIWFLLSQSELNNPSGNEGYAYMRRGRLTFLLNCFHAIIYKRTNNKKCVI
jgi:hypothetical protein